MPVPELHINCVRFLNRVVCLAIVIFRVIPFGLGVGLGRTSIGPREPSVCLLLSSHSTFLYCIVQYGVMLRDRETSF